MGFAEPSPKRLAFDFWRFFLVMSYSPAFRAAQRIVRGSAVNLMCMTSYSPIAGASTNVVRLRRSHSKHKAVAAWATLRLSV